MAVLPGLGDGFFNDRAPTVLPVGIDPIRVVVGTFDGTVGLITLNFGANDLTYVRDFLHDARASEIATDGSPVDVIAGDFNRDRFTDLIVANESNGLFELIAGGPNGPAIAEVLASTAVSHPTALQLGQVGNGVIDFFAVNAGQEAAFRLTFAVPPPQSAAELLPLGNSVLVATLIVRPGGESIFLATVPAEGVSALQGFVVGGGGPGAPSHPGNLAPSPGIISGGGEAEVIVGREALREHLGQAVASLMRGAGELSRAALPWAAPGIDPTWFDVLWEEVGRIGESIIDALAPPRPQPGNESGPEPLCAPPAPGDRAGTNGDTADSPVADTGLLITEEVRVTPADLLSEALAPEPGWWDLSPASLAAISAVGLWHPESPALEATKEN